MNKIWVAQKERLGVVVLHWSAKSKTQPLLLDVLAAVVEAVCQLKATVCTSLESLYPSFIV